MNSSRLRDKGKLNIFYIYLYIYHVQDDLYHLLTLYSQNINNLELWFSPNTQAKLFKLSSEFVLSVLRKTGPVNPPEVERILCTIRKYTRSMGLKHFNSFHPCLAFSFPVSDFLSSHKKKKKKKNSFPCFHGNTMLWT